MPSRRIVRLETAIELLGMTQQELASRTAQIKQLNRDEVCVLLLAEAAERAAHPERFGPERPRDPADEKLLSPAERSAAIEKIWTACCEVDAELPGVERARIEHKLRQMGFLR